MTVAPGLLVVGFLALSAGFLMPWCVAELVVCV